MYLNTQRLTSGVYVNSRSIEKITDVNDVREICKFQPIPIILSVDFPGILNGDGAETASFPRFTKVPLRSGRPKAQRGATIKQAWEEGRDRERNSQSDSQQTSSQSDRQTNRQTDRQTSR